MTKYFVDQDGNYLGGFDGAEPPAGSVEVPNPPSNGRQVWDGSAFVDPVPTVADYQAAVQGVLDSAARSKNYDDIVSACSYAGAPNPFQTEGQAFLTWRGNVWASCYQILAEVQAGQRAAPSIPELLAGLPSFQP